MQFSLRQAAEVFAVPETKVIEWVTQNNLPAVLVRGQYRFDRAELLEWAALRQQPLQPSIYLKVNGDLNPAATRLADALEIGGVVHDIDGTNLREIIGKVLDGLPIPESIGVDTLCDLILTREDFGSTAIGGGIAVPHPRQPVILMTDAPLVRLCYLRRPLDLKGPDGAPIDKLFVMICPTAHDHLQLLARLGAVLKEPSVQAALQEKAGAKRIIEAIREAGSRLDGRQSERNQAS